jgi:glycosyltransferase involved in cell wall biosynthesis
MNIVHTEASTGWGGQEIRILNEARGLIGRGHAVQILAAESARILEEAPRYGVPACAAPIGRKSLWGILALRRWILAEQRRSPIDVINTHSSTDSWLVALACLALRVRPVQVRTRHISAPVPNNLASHWLYDRACRMIVTTGSALREQLIHDNRLAPGRIVSVPTGIDSSLFSPPTEEERQRARARLEVNESVFVVGIVATLRSWKGHRYLLDALRLILSLDPHAEVLVVIVGDGPQRRALEGQVAAAHLDRHVHFAGNQNDVVGWLHGLDAFTLPSYANEGVPQAILQAMACGLPVVTTDAGAISEVAHPEETALVVPVRDADALMVALMRLIKDRPLGQRLGGAARELVCRQHTEEGMLDQMEEVFQRALTPAAP